MKQFISSRIAMLKIVVIVIGVFMTIFYFKDAVTIWKGDQARLYEKGREDYETGELVSGKLNYALDVVATLESSQTVYGVPVTKKLTPYYLCVVPADEKTGAEGYFLIVHVTSDEGIEKLDELVDKTQAADSDEDYANIEPVYMEFTTRPVPDEVMDYAVEYLDDGTWSEDERRESIAICMLDETKFSAVRFFPLVGLVIALVPILLYFISKKRVHSYKSSRTHYVAPDNGIDYNTPPERRDGADPTATRRYSADAYERYSTRGIQPEEDTNSNDKNDGRKGRKQPDGPVRRYDPSAYSGGAGTYEPGKMDEIDLSVLDKKD